MKLFWTYFNVCDHNTSTSQADGRTETACYNNDTALCISHRAVKIKQECEFRSGYIECIKLFVWVLSHRTILFQLGLIRNVVLTNKNRPDERYANLGLFNQSSQRC